MPAKTPKTAVRATTPRHAVAALRKKAHQESRPAGAQGGQEDDRPRRQGGAPEPAKKAPAVQQRGEGRRPPRHARPGQEGGQRRRPPPARPAPKALKAVKKVAPAARSPPRLARRPPPARPRQHLGRRLRHRSKPRRKSRPRSPSRLQQVAGRRLWRQSPLRRRRTSLLPPAKPVPKPLEKGYTDERFLAHQKALLERERATYLEQAQPAAGRGGPARRRDGAGRHPVRRGVGRGRHGDGRS